MIPSVDPDLIGMSCGVDLVDIASFGRALDVTGGRMQDVCFTDREQREAADRSERLAARWAVKEAVAKALGVGLLRGVGFHDVEVTVGDGGALSLALRGEARLLAKARRLDRWSISVSHERGLAIGFVIATQWPSQDTPRMGEEEGHG
jgi:holo-[acyl-carrier protein] synthase